VTTTTAATRFDQLYSTHSARVRRIVAGMVARRDVDDVVQQIWLRIWTELQAYPTRETTRSWLDTIAADTCRRHRRDTARRPTVALADHDLLTPDRLDAQIELDQLLSQLPSGDQEIIRLHHIDGYTVQEIADQLDVPAGTIKSRLSRARRKLKKVRKSE